MEDLIIIGEHDVPGYLPVTKYESWLVAIINYAERLEKKNLCRMEKHLLTDEAFVLLSGNATLYVAEGNEKPQKIYPIELQEHKVYQVKKGVWHCISMEPETKVLVVENDNTSEANSAYWKIGTEHGILLPDLS